MEFNKLLKRQLSKYFPQGIPDGMDGFLYAVNSSYEHYETDRSMIERSMELSSAELTEANSKIREESKKQKLVLDKLKDSINALRSAGIIKDEMDDIRDEGDVLDAVNALKKLIERTQKAEKNLYESEERHRTVVESLSEGLIITDVNDVIVFANKRMSDITGYNMKDMLGNQAHKIFFQPEEWDNIWIKHSQRVNGMNERYEAPMVRSNGAMFYGEISAAPYLNSEGKIVGTVAAINDISHRVQLMNDLELINKELRDYAYIVSHDLKAPLRAIKSLAQWISKDYEDKFDEPGRNQMKLLMGRVDRMFNLIEGILEYSKIGRVKDTIQSVDLNTVINEVIETVDVPGNITLDVQKPLPVINFDKVRIQQVFQNLISNAIKYNDKKEGRINILQNCDDKSWHFIVEDNGPGISPAYHEKIFQIFQTLHARDNFESTGIGLSIVKRTMQTYGGKVWIESAEGEGAKFHFSFPKEII